MDNAKTHAAVVVKALAWACLALISAAGVVLEAQDNNAQNPSEVSQSSSGNTVQSATMLYHQGMRDLDRALDLAEKAGLDDSGKSAKLLAKSAKANESAIQQFTQALQANPKMIEGYAALGLAYRRLDKYQEALEIHAIALRRDSESLENFEGWSEALMHLNMLGNATSSYESYTESDSERAAILMAEIKEWLAEKQADPGDLDPAHIQRLADWVEQQESGS